MAKFTDADRLRWVSTGQLVWAPLRRTLEDQYAGRAFKGVVTIAAGVTAYVECPARPEWSSWFDVLDLFPREPEPPKPGGRESIPEPVRKTA